MDKLKGLLEDYSTTEAPDFESLLSANGSSPKQTEEVAHKGKERVQALYRILAYWTPERLDRLALRHALNWHSPLRLGKQYERAYLHYLGWMEEVFNVFPNAQMSAPHHRYQIDLARDIYPSLLRELRERIEFVYRRATDLQGKIHSETIAGALYQQEKDQTSEKLVRIAGQVTHPRLDEPSLAKAITQLTEFLEHHPELRQLPHEHLSDLAQRIKSILDSRGDSVAATLKRLGEVREQTPDADAEALKQLDKILKLGLR